ncbi:ras-associating and dilute domain-containing protein isoform X8 [Canis lupus dingo]|uniref:ras-associating and dilute domain-containing protein isoform X8 n=1 Tax=Canis lupus dingo TaxID=286419 RepID=UPI0015F17BE3|nr:ras-associating and dilute domain-containing protein isoform X8 [Canis lupus dingo]
MFAPRLLDFQKTKYARFMNHRVPAHKRYQPTEYEHAANCATHALWIIPSILGSSNLYLLSDDDWETISAWIYGLGLCGLFVVSTVFHTISWKKSHLRMVEHCLHMFDRMVIYFFIAASYAPWLNLRELGPWASHMRWLVWIMASVGTIYVFFFHERTQPLPCHWPEPSVLVHDDWPTMFYGTHFIMSPPTKSKLKRQSQLLSSVLSRTLSYKYRDLDTTFSSLGASDDPAELSTQLSAPGVLKVFGDSVCTGTHYKSVLATGMSSAQELVKEALERYALSPECASQYVLCDVVGQAGDPGQQWQAECFRVFGDNEKPLLIQELWKPREGLSRRFELRKRSDVEELAAKDVDTLTAGINAQARRLQRSRAKGTPALASEGAQSPPTPRLRRTVSESSLSSATTPGPEERGQETMRYSLYESPHLLLLQGYSQQHDSLVYLLNREQHTVGQRTPSSKPSHSATRLEPGSFGQLLLKIAKAIRETVWEKTKELAEKQAQLQEPISLASFSMAGLVPDLQHILFWMSNSVELLYFIQQKCPLYMQSLEEELDVTGSKESLFSCTLTASEEAMAVLEEVILYAFQQCVYYVSKVQQAAGSLRRCAGPCMSASRPCWSAPLSRQSAGRAGALLPNCRRSCAMSCPCTRPPWTSCGSSRCTLRLPPRCWRTSSSSPALCSSTSSWTRALLTARGLERQLLPARGPAGTWGGPSLSCFHWPRGVQACARLQQLLEWMRSTGYGEAGECFFRKLSCTLNLLATPRAQLIQMSWANLRAAFPTLSPAQLHRLLTQYQLASAMGPMSAWEPGAQDSPDAFKSEDVLESYENPPPIVLPSEGFQVDLEADCLDDSIYQHLLYIRHFLWSLRSKPSPGGGPSQPEYLQGPHHTTPEGHPEGQSCPLVSRGAREASQMRALPSSGAPRAQGPPGRQSRGGPQAGPLQADSSCLLTPPGTPLGLEPAVPDWPEPGGTCGQALLEGRRNGQSGSRGAAPEGDGAGHEDEPPAAPSSHSSSTEDFCYVFVVELERGPSGLGMGLIDGMHTPLGSPGLYIQTLLPGSPAASDGRLSLGDRILEVNGSSLMGVSYLRAVDLIRHGGKKMRFLVAKSDVETAKKIRFRTPPP